MYVNLNDGSCKPYKKPNDETTYVQKESNHPPNVIKKLQSMIEQKNSDLSSTNEIFVVAKGYYKGALKKSGYNQTLKFKPQQAKGRRKNRQRNVIWFNPPFSKNVKTRVAQEFLKLIDKHFSNNRKYRKIFNRNNVKVSYSSMPNIGSIISGHNKRVLEEKTTRNERQCSCHKPDDWTVLNGQCLAKGVLYEAAVNFLTSLGTKKRYTKASQTGFSKIHSRSMRKPSDIGNI